MRVLNLNKDLMRVHKYESPKRVYQLASIALVVRLISTPHALSAPRLLLYKQYTRLMRLECHVSGCVVRAACGHQRA